jgi:hypothetical protein
MRLSAVAITEVIAKNMILIESHVILPKDLFRLNPKPLEIKL